MIIDLPRFIESERPTWAELESALGRIERDPGHRFDLPGALRFHYLYQRAAGDLARLGTFASEPELRRYLESLVARAYTEVHESREKQAKFRPVRTFTRDFPAAFQRHRRAFLLALTLLLAGGLFGGLAHTLDPEAKSSLVPAQFAHLMSDPARRVAEEEAGEAEELTGRKASFSTALMTNNIRVSILALALGMTCGAGTLILLFYNGVLLGLVAADYLLAGQGVFLAGWLLPHGATEIPAILIGGQAGFVLARAMIGRGDRQPLTARLRAVGRDVALLGYGFAVLLIWAGLVEAFLSQYHAPVLPYSVKIAFGAIELVLLVLLLSGGGRNSSPQSSQLSTLNSQPLP